ncbi:ABC transporter permease [Paenibacillus mendelii]|uniref:ABC transporter permease n=1 Tax=Paenibacillus mendelii TaxID=206163 RepID=A0ABV6J8E9_9BACL|nr:ABC transporter permease [Paenibacillus mendelii]MCQ6560214.1 ABC transporter permease [Paenibacillus mendelii]
MISFFKKDFLVHWRDRKEIIISLISPLVIIAVIGIALPGWVENPTKTLQIKVALVNADDEQAAMQEFRDSLAARSLPDDELLDIEQQLEQLSPIRMLKQVFQAEHVKEIVSMEELGNDDALQQLQEERIAAVVTIPDGFTLAALNKMVWNDGEGTALRIIAEKASLQVGVLNDIIDGYVQKLNVQSAFHHLLGADAGAAAIASDDYSGIGGREMVDGVETVTSFQYYALAISIVFALLLSVTMASKAITEKRERTFQRILLTGSQPFHYLMGKMSAAFCLSILQLSIIILISHFALNIFPGRSLLFWLGVSAVLVLLSLCVGALVVLFTALVFRLHDETANGIAFIFSLIAGTIGGSFVPIYILPDWLRSAGEWTPNGLSLAVLLQWIQTETVADLSVPLVKLAVFAIATIGLASWCFPRRGRI